MSGRRTDILRGTLAFAEREYALAEFIDQTSRQQEQRAYWAAQIERLCAEIEAGNQAQDRRKSA